MFTSLRLTLLTVILAFVLVACGEAEDPNATPEPTNTPFPTFEYVAPTNPPIFDSEATDEAEATEDAEAAESVATLDPVMVERGLGRYEALECASCHGENGEGTDDGGALIGLELSQADFISFMRSGGELGSEHQFSTDRLSERGSQNLYAYLLSLGE